MSEPTLDLAYERWVEFLLSDRSDREKDELARKAVEVMRANPDDYPRALPYIETYLARRPRV